MNDVPRGGKEFWPNLFVRVVECGVLDIDDQQRRARRVYRANAAEPPVAGADRRFGGTGHGGRGSNDETQGRSHSVRTGGKQ